MACSHEEDEPVKLVCRLTLRHFCGLVCQTLLQSSRPFCPLCISANPSVVCQTFLQSARSIACHIPLYIQSGVENSYDADHLQSQSSTKAVILISQLLRVNWTKLHASPLPTICNALPYGTLYQHLGCKMYQTKSQICNLKSMEFPIIYGHQEHISTTAFKASLNYII